MMVVSAVALALAQAIAGPDAPAADYVLAHAEREQQVVAFVDVASLARLGDEVMGVVLLAGPALEAGMTPLITVQANCGRQQLRTVSGRQRPDSPSEPYPDSSYEAVAGDPAAIAILHRFCSRDAPPADAPRYGTVTRAAEAATSLLRGRAVGR